MATNCKRSIRLGAAVAVAATFSLACSAASVATTPAQGFELTTSSFLANGDIPVRYTCEGADVSPALRWTDPPAGTRSFTLIVEDPDAPGTVFTHWVLYNLPPNSRALPEALPAHGEARGARQGRNDFGKSGYGGPCPPPGTRHRYYFKLYAVDRLLDVPSGLSRAEVEKALRGHVLGQAEVMGRFRR